MRDKFEDCKYCKNRRTDICDDCDSGEQFEDIEDEGLRFEYKPEVEDVAA